MSRGTAIKEIEEFPRRIRIFVIVILLMLILGTLGFWAMDGGHFGLAFIRTLQTLAFIFSEDSLLYERLLEIFLAIVGVFLIWWVLWSIADMILDGNLRKYLKLRFYTLKVQSMKDHIIIVGGGRVGEEIARVISAKEHNFLIIENNEVAIKYLRKKGYTVLEGNAEDENILKEAKIEYAKKIVLTIPRTEANILITLTAKELNPKIEIYARSDEPSLVSKLKRAGAKVVIVPEIVAGDKIAQDLKL
ncbi:NAD-binding protein [Candidatus Pacearchaeota archaeon]|nr:NAD-binding protein [Candidatus Pacearchaeota archaeon]